MSILYTLVVVFITRAGIETERIDFPNAERCRAAEQQVQAMADADLTVKTKCVSR